MFEYTVVITKLPLVEELNNFASEKWRLYSEHELADGSFRLIFEREKKD